MTIKSSRFLYGLLAATVLVLPLVFFGSGFFASASEKVLPGIEVMGVRLEGLNKADGTVRLQELEKNLRATRVVLKHQDRIWPLLLNEVGFGLNEEAIMNAALQAGRQGSPIQRWQERKRFRETGLILQPELEFEREKLEQRVKELTREITVEPRDATFKINPGDTVTVVPGTNGVGVDMDKLQKELTSVLLEGKKPEVTLSLVPVAPARSTEMVQSMGINGLLAGYTTKFDPSKVSRTYNISVAAKALDELLVQPGHVVSFNKVVGPRSSEAGYKTAPVIVNNEFVDGIGGGVCQVSTTLYNAILLANLEVVERSNHSLPVSYVPKGRDATVFYDSIDFKFRNNTEGYLYLKSYVSGGQITFKIYGNTAYKRDVTVNTWITREVEPKVIYETDPNLPRGVQVVKQEGSKGYKVAAQRVVLRNGVVEKREALPSSDYKAVNKVIAVGTSDQIKPQLAPSTPPQAPDQQNKPPLDVDGLGNAVPGGAEEGGAVNPAIPGASLSQPADGGI
ncbi:MAG: VanW family protein [Firmicutes bacterium]|nr:VanW family protein [Bacillota bacterium]